VSQMRIIDRSPPPGERGAASWRSMPIDGRPRRLRIYEVPVSYAGRTYEEGKKIGWRDGVSALRCIVKYTVLDRTDRSPAPPAAGAPQDPGQARESTS
jgi:hypothetical protein